MNTIQFKCPTCKTEQMCATVQAAKASQEYWCETCQAWRPIQVVSTQELFEPVIGPDPRD